MPDLVRVLKSTDLSSARSKPAMDLTPYLSMIDDIATEDGVGGEIKLRPGESQRTEKRRLSLAAKIRKLTLTWRKSEEGTLRFVLSKPGERAPGGRRRKDTR